MDERRKHLASSSLFRGLDEDQLSELLQIAEMELFDEGAVVFSEGDPGERLYVVMQGQVRVSLPVMGDGEEALAILGPGETFGEMSAIDDVEKARSASATAHSDCSLLGIAKHDFQMLLSTNHAVAYVVLRNIVRDLSAQLRATNHKVMFLSSAGRF